MVIVIHTSYMNLVGGAMDPSPPFSKSLNEGYHRSVMGTQVAEQRVMGAPWLGQGGGEWYKV